MTERSNLRLFVLRALVLALLLTLGGRLWYLQVMAGPTYRQAAADNNVRSIVTPATRGVILDDYGRPLVSNTGALVVSVDRATLQRQPDGGRAVLIRLARMLHTTYADLHRRIQLCSATVHPPCWNGSPYQPIPVSTAADTRIALQILEQQARFPGVSAQLATVRSYPQEKNGVSAAHLLGYLGPITAAEQAKYPAPQQAAHVDDQVGRAGLEESYNRYLSGSPGVQQVSVDHLGSPTGVVGQTPPTNGDTLVTSIDVGVQHDLEQALASAVRTARGTSQSGGGANPNLPSAAAGVVLDARTGRIVAMASDPTYSPSVFVGGVSAKEYAALSSQANGEPLYDKALSGTYLPGSTFKLITASAVLADGEASQGGLYACPPQVQFAGSTFGNFEGESFGAFTLADAIIVSCDTVFYGFGQNEYTSDQRLIAAHRKPAEAVAHMAMDYGYGRSSGVDLPGAASGMVLDRQGVYNYWKTVDLPNACKGAKNPAFPPSRRAVDENLCRYGYIFEPGDQLLLNIGQGGSIGISPLQEAVAYAALVNGGTVFSPRVGEALVSPSGKLVKLIKPTVNGRVPLSAGDLQYLMQAFEGVTRSTAPRGTAQGAFMGFPFDRVTVGGKTGTADVTNASCATCPAPNAWFASFAGPAGQSPEFVSVIMVTNGGQGGIVSAPATRQLWDGVFGLEGHRAAFRTQAPPAQLPRFYPDGTVVGAPASSSGGAPAGTAIGALPAALPPDVGSPGAKGTGR